MQAPTTKESSKQQTWIRIASFIIDYSTGSYNEAKRSAKFLADENSIAIQLSLESITDVGSMNRRISLVTGHDRKSMTKWSLNPRDAGDTPRDSGSLSTLRSPARCSVSAIPIRQVVDRHMKIHAARMASALLNLSFLLHDNEVLLSPCKEILMERIPSLTHNVIAQITAINSIEFW